MSTLFIQCGNEAGLHSDQAIVIYTVCLAYRLEEMHKTRQYVAMSTYIATESLTKVQEQEDYQGVSQALYANVPHCHCYFHFALMKLVFNICFKTRGFGSKA